MVFLKSSKEHNPELIAINRLNLNQITSTPFNIFHVHFITKKC